MSGDSDTERTQPPTAKAAPRETNVLSRNPWLPYALILVTVATVSEAYLLPKLAFSGGSISLSEMVLFVALAATAYLVYQGRSEFPVWLSATGLLLVVLLVASAIGFPVAMSNHVPLRSALEGGRIVLFFAAYWSAFVALRSASGRRVIFALSWLVAVGTVVLMVAQIVVGGAHPLFITGGQAQFLSASSEWGGILRVRPPGLLLVYVVAAFAVSYLVWGPRAHRGVAAVTLLACLTGLVLSLNRNMMIGLPLALVCATVFARRRRRGFVAAAVIALVAVFAFGVLPKLTSNPVAQRVDSVTNIGGKSGTLAVRAQDNNAALKVLARNPIFGIGWGSYYGRIAPVHVGATEKLEQVTWVHNQYLYYWMRAGIVGVLALMAALLIAWIAGIGALRTTARGDFTWLGGAVVVAITEIALSSLVGMYLSWPEAIVPLTGVLALATVLSRETRPAHGVRERLSSGGDSGRETAEHASAGAVATSLGSVRQ